MDKIPLEKIHHINQRFNKIFNIPLYYCAGLVTVINYFLPYSLRIVVAFLINIFFNRPIVYLNVFAAWIGKRINVITTSIFYLIVLGSYAILYRLLYIFNLRKKKSLWHSLDEKNCRENYYYQS